MNENVIIIPTAGTDCHECYYFINRMPCRDMVCGVDVIYEEKEINENEKE